MITGLGAAQRTCLKLTPIDGAAQFDRMDGLQSFENRRPIIGAKGSLEAASARSGIACADEQEGMKSSRRSSQA